MRESSLHWEARVVSATGSSACVVPRRIEDEAAKIQPPVCRVLESQNVCLDVTECGLWPVHRSFGERLDDCLLETDASWMRCDDLGALVWCEFVVRNAEHIHLDASSNESHDRLLVLWDARCGVQSNGVPNLFDLGLANLMSRQELASCIRSIDFEALGGGAVRWHQAHVVEHGSDVEHLSVKGQLAPFSSHCTKQENPFGMVEEEVSLRVADQFGRLPRKEAVREANTSDRGGHSVFFIA